MSGREYSFSLVVEGLDVDDDSQIEALYGHGCDDATVEDRSSLALVTFYREGAEPRSVLWSAISDVEAAVPGCRVIEIDEQLVSARDIADRVARTPESIRQLAAGRRGPGNFPVHVGEVGKGIKVWRWADVQPWLAAQGFTRQDTPLPLAVIVEANGDLQEVVRTARKHPNHPPTAQGGRGAGQTGVSLARSLVGQGMASEKDMVAALATQIGMDFVDLKVTEIDGRAATMISERLMRRHLVIPIRATGGKLIVAAADPTNVVALGDIQRVTGMEVDAVVATKDDILEAIGEYATTDSSSPHRVW